MWSIHSIVEQNLDDKIISSQLVGGGCIAKSEIIHLQSGKRYFLKSGVNAPAMFLKEAHGLQELAKACVIKIPKVIIAHEQFLLLELIEQGIEKVTFFVDFGRAFAMMHQFSQANFGFFEDNYIGSSMQYNIGINNELSDWGTFYYNKRIIPQLRMAEERGVATKELVKHVVALEHKMDKILDGSSEKPALLHGDLWSGNFMCDTMGEPVLIDPAVYYGHREADLAMTKMFGGFSPEFYKSYQQTYPLKQGWEYREKLYLMYHYFNHFNLFGSSYYQTTINLIKYYL